MLYVTLVLAIAQASMVAVGADMTTACRLLAESIDESGELLTQQDEIYRRALGYHGDADPAVRATAPAEFEDSYDLMLAVGTLFYDLMSELSGYSGVSAVLQEIKDVTEQIVEASRACIDYSTQAIAAYDEGRIEDQQRLGVLSSEQRDLIGPLNARMLELISSLWAMLRCPDLSIEVPGDVAADEGASFDGIEVTWTSSENADGYRLFRTTAGCDNRDPWELVADDISADETAYWDEDVLPGETYSYVLEPWVGSRPSEGGDTFYGWYSQCASGYVKDVPTAPEPPALLASDGDYEDKIRIEYRLEGASFFNLYRAEEGSNRYQFLGYVYPSSDYYDDVPPEAGTAYSYKMMARAAGCSGTGCYTDYSEPDTGYMPVVGSPAAVQATDGEYPDQVVITWNAVTEGGPWTHTVERAEAEGAFEELDGAVGLSDTTFIDTDVVRGEEYSYRVFSTNTDGPTEYSESDSGYVFDGPAFPDPPEVTASDGEFEDKIRITFALYGASYFNLYRAEEGSNQYQFLNYVFPSRGYYDDVPPEAGTLYSYRMIARGAGCSGTGCYTGYCEPDTGYMAEPEE